jgi:hypothetical protein
MQNGLVWPVLAFDAEVLDWSFDFAPPAGRKRHHIKAATSVQDHYISLELTVKAEEHEKLAIHWSAIGGLQSGGADDRWKTDGARYSQQAGAGYAGFCIVDGYG